MSQCLTINVDCCSDTNGGGNTAIAAQNSIINGGCVVAQRNAPSLSGTYQFGQVDRFAVKADGTPTTGTVNQTQSAPIGRSGYALHVADVTTGSGGTVAVRYRMESIDSRMFRDVSAVFQCLVYHDVGADIDYTVSIAKADSVDDFTTVTTIATQMESVPDQTGTQLSVALTPCDCGNGLEFTVTATTGAITSKNFYLTEAQFEVGSTPTQFVGKTISDEFNACLRYAWVLRPNLGTGSPGVRFGLGQVTQTGAAQMWLPTPTTMRAAPIASISNVSDFALADALSVNHTMTSFATINSQLNGMAFNAFTSGGLAVGNATQWFGINTNAFFLFDAEL